MLNAVKKGRIKSSDKQHKIHLWIKQERKNVWWKKDKEAQDKIQELELSQKRYRHLGADIQKTKDASDEIFALLQVQDGQLDQGLNRVVDILKEERESTLAVAEQMNLLSLKMEDTASKGSQMKEAFDQRGHAISEGKKVAVLIQEVAELCAETDKNVREKNADTNKAFEQTFEEVAKMQEMAKHMSVLALNAAIEAGRLGESGLNFLQSAESVRKLSEEYIKMIDGLKEQLEAVKEQAADDSCLQQMDKIQQKTKEAASSAKVFSAEDTGIEIDLTEQLQKQKEQLKDIEETMQKKESNYQDALDQMEFVGQNYMDSRNAKEDLEEKLALFYSKAL